MKSPCLISFLFAPHHVYQYLKVNDIKLDSDMQYPTMGILATPAHQSYLPCIKKFKKLIVPYSTFFVVRGSFRGR